MKEDTHRPLVEVLMGRDMLTEAEALDLIQQAREELMLRLGGGGEGDPFEICQDWFNLEPDYIEELL